MNTLEQRFAAHERFIRDQPGDIRRRYTGNGLVEISLQPDPITQCSSNSLEERWVQLYVKEHHKRLGFSAARGPRPRGPDFAVLKGGRWRWAEVEIRWQSYFDHRHHINPSFERAEYLILLSTGDPSPAKREHLPRQIIHIDRQHFKEWYLSSSAPERIADRNNVRIEFLAGEMQAYWNTICQDVHRQMATCPACDDCPYFGEEGMPGEATAYFTDLAAQLLVKLAMSNGSLEADLTKIGEAVLREFVEKDQIRRLCED